MIRPPVLSEEDTDENHPVKRAPTLSRTLTPADEQLRDVLSSLLECEDAAVPAQYRLAFEAIAARVTDDRLFFEQQLAKIEQPGPRPWGRLLAVVKGIGAGGIFAALAFSATALQDRGKASEVARAQVEYVQKLAVSVEKLAVEYVTLRAQAAGHEALLQVLAARLSAAPSH